MDRAGNCSGELSTADTHYAEVEQGTGLYRVGSCPVVRVVLGIAEGLRDQHAERDGSGQTCRVAGGGAADPGTEQIAEGQQGRGWERDVGGGSGGGDSTAECMDGEVESQRGVCPEHGDTHTKEDGGESSRRPSFTLMNSAASTLHCSQQSGPDSGAALTVAAHCGPPSGRTPQPVGVKVRGPRPGGVQQRTREWRGPLGVQHTGVASSSVSKKRGAPNSKLTQRPNMYSK